MVEYYSINRLGEEEQESSNNKEEIEEIDIATVLQYVKKLKL